jgi:hypothetical protein
MNLPEPTDRDYHNEEARKEREYVADSEEIVTLFEKFYETDKDIQSCKEKVYADFEKRGKIVDQNQIHDEVDEWY